MSRACTRVCPGGEAKQKSWILVPLKGETISLNVENKGGERGGLFCGMLSMDHWNAKRRRSVGNGEAPELKCQTRAGKAGLQGGQSSRALWRLVKSACWWSGKSWRHPGTACRDRIGREQVHSPVVAEQRKNLSLWRHGTSL